MKNNPGTGNGRIAVYSRKSKFTGKGESIGNQIELCRQYIRLHYGEKAERDILVYEDEGFSGGNTDRPRFRDMMRDARKNFFSAIVCYRLDRISRNIADFAKLIEELASLDISFISIREQFDTSLPIGRAMMYIASVFSQLERETIAERIRDNMLELAKTGRWLGGVTPTGYASEAVERVTADGRKRKAYRLKILPQEAETVRLIYRIFLETGSLTKTETYLMQNGQKSKNGRFYSRFAIRGILTNPVYLIADRDSYLYLKGRNIDLFSEEKDFDGKRGIMAYNKTVQKHGKANRARDPSEWIVAVGSHRGMIGGADWIKAQQTLAINKSKSYRKPRSGAALLSGLLFCGRCGSYLRPKLTKRKNAEGEPLFSYLCERKEKSRRRGCSIKNPNGNALDRAVCEEIGKLGESGREFQKQLETDRPVWSGSRAESADELEQLRKSDCAAGKELEELAASLSRTGNTAAKDYIIRQINGLDEKRQVIRKRIGELADIGKEAALSGAEFGRVLGILSSFRKTMEEMDTEQKRKALRALTEKIVWDGENAQIYLTGSGRPGESSGSRFGPKPEPAEAKGRSGAGRPDIPPRVDSK